MIEYNFWRHRNSGEVYAIRTDNGKVIGCCGPLAYDEVNASDLPYYYYDDNPEDAEWAQEHEAHFALVETSEP